MTDQTRDFDGVICFGGCDWWYHNRGHYDLQMMRELRAHVPVLYVNSIGVRVPKLGEGSMFFKRVVRKLGSLKRGYVRVDDSFAVVSPFVVPGKAGLALSKRLLVPQVRDGARRLGIKRPLVWITCPPGAEAVDGLNPNAVVYERTDRWEAFPEADREEILRYDRFMKQRADVTLHAASKLHEAERDDCRRALYVDHGVDYEMFASAGTADDALPADVADLPGPRVGFIGGIDDHTFDPGLFVEVARRLPDVSFFLVGSCSLPTGWCDLPNVRLLGKRPYEQVASYMAAADVLIMPWRQNEWIENCNPVKLKEYLAVGRPIVTTDFHELRRYDSYVRIASDPQGFAHEIRQAIESPDDPERLRGRVEQETWDRKATQVLDAVREPTAESLARVA